MRWRGGTWRGDGRMHGAAHGAMRDAARGSATRGATPGRSLARRRIHTRLNPHGVTFPSLAPPHQIPRGGVYLLAVPPPYPKKGAKVKLLSRIRGLYRFDGDEEPVLVSRRKFIFVGGAIGAALALPAGIAALAPAGPEIDVSGIIAAYYGVRHAGGGWVLDHKSLDGSRTITRPEHGRWFSRLDPRDPSQWHEVIPSVPRDVGKRIADGIKRHSWTPESWVEHCRRAESLYGDMERSHRRTLSGA